VVAPAPSVSALVDAELWDEFVAVGTRRSYPRGSMVFVEGDPPGDVYGLIEGRVNLSALTREGREVSVAHKGPGEIFGELTAIDGLPRSATATALDDLVVTVVSAARFVEFVERNPVLALPLLRVLAERLRAATTQHVSRRTGTTLQRVAAGLLELARFDVSGVRAEAIVTLRHEDLAAWVGCNREAVSRALSRLKADGLVSTGRGRIVLIDARGLRDLAT
jgi:CRP-like cAMP-binding protein